MSAVNSPLPPTKRLKMLKAKAASIEQALFCPITMQLPIEPVTAADGYVYEKTAIEKHMAGKRKSTSPISGEPMGKKLLPAPKIKNIIETSVAHGYISDKMREEWMQRLEEKEEQDYLEYQREEGDVYVTGEELWNLFNPGHITERGDDRGMYPKGHM